MVARNGTSTSICQKEKRAIPAWGSSLCLLMQSVAFHTLGCKLNYAETATLSRQFSSRGFQIVGIDDPAAIVVLNTCSVTERADRECRQLVRRALRTSPQAYVIIVGCYAQLQPETLGRIEGVDLILGASEKFDIFRHAEWKKTGVPRVRVSPISEATSFQGASSADWSERTRAFLKIQDGCDYSCAFCTIPLARGESRSSPLPQILEDARNAIAQGYRELVLTGVNVGDYGAKSQGSLLDVLQSLTKLDGLERIRISSVEPNLLTDELVDFWIESDKVCNHFHIPLQSGSPSVLSGMRRRYRREWYADRLERIVRQAPQTGIGSDVIVGFPGESPSAFEETYAFLVDQPLTYLHVFSYSKRPGTAAAERRDHVPAAVKAERSERLRILSGKKRRAFHESLVGETTEVLFESSGSVETGLTEHYAKVSVHSPTPLTNEIHAVRITEAGDAECFGALTKEWVHYENRVHSIRAASL